MDSATSTDTVESVLKKVHKKYSGAAYPYGAMNFHRHVGHTRRGRVNFLKISAPDSLMTTYQVNLISAESIWLDNTFCNSENHFPHFIFPIILLLIHIALIFTQKIVL